MLFVVIAKDHPGSAMRQKFRAEHLEFIADKQHLFRFGGPLLDETGKPAGSLMILDFPDRAALDKHLAQDPYFREPVFESVQIHETRWIVPEMQPGALAAEIAKQKAATAA
ncbi:MAG: YciI family protein [Ferrovibrio sp.]|nr:YciI family protein [Ferrovibrio sp.]